MLEKYKDIEFYINLTQEIIKEQSKVDSLLNDFIINIRLLEKTAILCDTSCSKTLLKYYSEIYIPNTEKGINKEMDITCKVIPTFHIFLKSMFKDIKIPIFIITILHELGHISFYNSDKLDIISEKLDHFHLVDDFLDIHKSKTKINKNILYRIRPFEMYADEYALSNFIRLYQILYKNKIVTEKINVPKLQLNKKEINNSNIIKKYKKEIYYNKKRVEFESENKTFTDKNKKSINTKYLYNCLFSIIDTEKNKNKDFKYLYDMYENCFKKNLIYNDISLDYYTMNIASALFPEFLNKINNNENYELDLSKF